MRKFHNAYASVLSPIPQELKPTGVFIKESTAINNRHIELSNKMFYLEGFSV